VNAPGFDPIHFPKFKISGEIQMKNYLQEGKTVLVIAPEAVDSGEFIVVGALSGVAVAAAAVTEEVELLRKGVFDLPKAGVALAQGDKLYWDSAAKVFTNDSSKTPMTAIAFAAALIGDATVSVLIGDGDGIRMVAGQHTTVTAADTKATGLSKVLGAIVSYDTDPADANIFVSATVGDQAGAPVVGSIIIKTWKSGDGADVTPTAATAFGKKVNYIAFGF
jgi:predicted RecA/RadA family phage recombinase